MPPLPASPSACILPSITGASFCQRATIYSHLHRLFNLLLGNFVFKEMWNWRGTMQSPTRVLANRSLISIWLTPLFCKMFIYDNFLKKCVHLSFHWTFPHLWHLPDTSWLFLASTAVLFLFCYAFDLLLLAGINLEAQIHSHNGIIHHSRSQLLSQRTNPLSSPHLYSLQM